MGALPTLPKRETTEKSSIIWSISESMDGGLNLNRSWHFMVRGVSGWEDYGNRYFSSIF